MAQVGKPFAVGMITICQLMALALWFSATAVLPQLRAEFDLGAVQSSLFTSSVLLGFVLGTLISAFFGLADRVEPRRFWAASALIAATANLLILTVPVDGVVVIGLRLITGVCMAGIYPIGMKMVATWSRGDTGFLVGLLVGALTMGSALPHLFAVAVPLDWRMVIVIASISAYIAGVAILFVKLGGTPGKSPRFDPRMVGQIWSNKPLRHACYGYFGHMWELYAMWGWIGLFLYGALSGREFDNPGIWAALLTFAIVGIGAFGSLAGGLLADRIGRTTVTMAAMAVSGICALVAGALGDASIPILIAVCIVWGISVIADSAQFSSCVIELADPHQVGTALTLQNAIGFIIALGSIHLVPVIADASGWWGAFAMLAVGPLLGFIAMGRLRNMPEAIRLAGGRR
ncbi:MFS transporter [Thalassospira sp. MCCC 1A03138]|uniref:MFS transporter n=1 Tax=Thalassospira sp. MCCC 1A03138 TaxID=1470576 RepID=UPI000A1FE60F|nr:MFS transporter [Thalassospira sp. MCCC 1A03138]OSQ29409.1 MFS transporter [Thalassospira sp. MCCC 1A03138]